MFISTSRLLLRPLWEEDAALACAEDFAPELRMLAALDLGPRGASCLVAARTQGAPRPIGLGGFAPKGSGACLWLQLRGEAQGHGYGREALDALLEMAFAGLRHAWVEAHASPETSWAHMLRAAGFQAAAGGAGPLRLVRQEWRKDATWFRAAA